MRLVRLVACQIGGAYVEYKISGFHYCDVIMGTRASQITSLTIVYSIGYSRRR